MNVEVVIGNMQQVAVVQAEQIEAICRILAPLAQWAIAHGALSYEPHKESLRRLEGVIELEKMFSDAPS